MPRALHTLHRRLVALRPGQLLQPSQGGGGKAARAENDALSAQDNVNVW